MKTLSNSHVRPIADHCDATGVTFSFPAGPARRLRLDTRSNRIRRDPATFRSGNAKTPVFGTPLAAAFAAA